MQTGRKIMNLRCDRRISQQDLARACDITPSALSKIEAGINSPRANIIWRIAKSLGVTIEYLLDEDMPYPHTSHSYRQDLLQDRVDPESVVRMEVTREEKAFLEALRRSDAVAQEVAFSVPSVSVETLRLIHFLVNHSKIVNPAPDFLENFRLLVTTGGVPRVSERAATSAGRASRTHREKVAR
jgi:transcriptional regulator with XRE-family HTH domain